MAKRLKKEKVNVDIINFGEEVIFHLNIWNIFYAVVRIFHILSRVDYTLILLLSLSFRR